MRLLALVAMLPAAATLNFVIFWRWFAYWRRHPFLTWTFMLGTLGALAVVLAAVRDRVFSWQLDLPWWTAVAGWLVVALSVVLGFIADRQLGLRVRSFTPFFEEGGRIQLRTTGAYAVVRHPIYASGIGFQLGVFLVTGVVAVGVSLAVFALGALWFTRQEERRLLELLEDQSAYQRYRERVPALLPWPRP